MKFRLSSLHSAACIALLGSSLHAQTWQSIASFPANSTPREYATAVESGGVIWIVGGTPLDGSGNARVHKLYESNGTLTTAALPLEGGALHGGVMLDSLERILVFSGLEGSTEGDDYWWTEADGNNGSFASRSSQAPKTYFALATDEDGLVYSLGGGPGASATAGNQNKARVERYDANANAWTVRAALPTPVADAAACSDGEGHILVIGGYGATGTLTANVARYDVASNTWSDTAIDDLPVALAGASAVLGVDGRVYVIGGTNGTAQNSTWILDAGATSWHAGPSLLTARQHAAAVLGNDQFIYVFGGGTGTNERIATPLCPRVEIDATSLDTFLGEPFGMSITVSGTPPFTYRWRHDGADLYDGVQVGGSLVSGAMTPTLGVLQSSTSDAGAYTCVITNACGSTTSPARTVTLRQTPPLPTTFSSRSLHPAGALNSHANAVDDGIVAGDGLYPDPMYTSLYHPITWDAQRIASDLTPANSVGGSINAMRDGVKAGWFWWPVWTPQGTGYYQHACAWSAADVHADLQPQGWETGTINNTDGVHHVGWAFYDADHSIAVDGVYWASSAPFDYTLLTGGGNFGTSGANMGALDGGRLFGTLFGVTPYDATMWRKPASGPWTTTDIAPATSYGSYIADAQSGLQVGRATMLGVTQAGLWGGTSNSFVRLTPSTATSAEATATRDGVQVGFATVATNTTHAFAWRGTAASALDLHAFAPGGFSTESAADLEIDAFGTVTIVGSGTNTVAGRVEALEWRGNPRALSTEVEQVSVAAGATVNFTLYGGQQHAGKNWTLLAAVSSATGGSSLRQLLVGSSGTGQSAILSQQAGALDALGFASAHVDIPAGAVTSPLNLIAVFYVREPNGTLSLKSNLSVTRLVP